jgi:hypothetical protein
MISWQNIFSQSKVNNGIYDGDRLVAQSWSWPEETWFQIRLRDLRKSKRERPRQSTRQNLH